MSFQTCKTFIHFLNEIKIFMMKSKIFLTLHRQQCKLNVPKPITIARTSVKLMRVLSSELSQDAAHTCHPSAALIRRTLRRERHAHRWPSGWGEQCWLDQQGERPITELWGAEKLGRSDGSGMLIGDPLVEGSSASSTDGEPWRAENSFLGMRGTQLPMRSSRAENSLLRVRPITSSGEWRTHSSEWEGTPPLRRERQAQPWALESGELIPQNERELPAQQGAACS